MKTILINKHKKHYLEKNEALIIKEGKITTRNITSNGKIIINEICLKKGDLILNYLEFFKKNELISKQELELEIEALEDSILEKMFMTQSELVNKFHEKILSQLLNKTALDFLYQMYNTKGYILSKLKRYSNIKGWIIKKEVKVEDFNIGRTQFYKNYSELLADKYIREENGRIYLNLQKIDKYLLEIEN